MIPYYTSSQMCALSMQDVVQGIVLYTFISGMVDIAQEIIIT